ncbi:MAG: hypothetical protein IJJ00_00965 [Erysipelotrichaceae bacterium]|nr:hypothetical protein [Erysipelotrichaceae bacterium]
MDYSAANQSLWGFIIQIGYIALAILLADFLRHRISFVRKLMMPVAVLGGFLLLAAKYAGLTLNESLLETLVFHGIALGFVAMSLRTAEKESEASGNMTGLKSGAIIVSTYLVQGLTGLLITVLLSYTLMPGLFKAAGMLLPMGYGQGPGQANNIGSTYEGLGFAGGRSFGMSIAASGYLVACIVGVIILNILRNKGKFAKADKTAASASINGDYNFEKKSDGTDSIDVLSVQVSMVLVVYLIAFLAIWGLTSGLSALLPGAAKMLNSLIWGFNFIIASAVAMLFKKLFPKEKTIVSKTLQSQNNYLLNRISGFFFDIMIVAGIASINLEDIKGLWLPFILMVSLGGLVTWFYLSFVCRKVYKDYYYQGLISMFGMLTGTISSGVLLLREVDGNFETPAANNLITGSSFGIVLGAPILVLVGLAAKSDTMCLVSMGIMVVYLLLLLTIILKLKRKKAE